MFFLGHIFQLVRAQLVDDDLYTRRGLDRRADQSALTGNGMTHTQNKVNGLIITKVSCSVDSFCYFLASYFKKKKKIYPLLVCTKV